jgi:hypothetical protein
LKVLPYVQATLIYSRHPEMNRDQFPE